MIDEKELERIGLGLINAIGESPAREGLRETPRRFAKWWKEFIEYDPGKLGTTFEAESWGGQINVVANMRVWSLCEHHLLPFWCDVSIGYRANGRVLGLSKFARIAHKHAHRLQIQERLIQDIGREIKLLTHSQDVIVMGQGVHLCMVMRGIKTDGLMTSIASWGEFEESADLRREFLSIVRNSKKS
jgi:GTP cyclohydrolase I